MHRNFDKVRYNLCDYNLLPDLKETGIKSSLSRTIPSVPVD